MKYLVLIIACTMLYACADDGAVDASASGPIRVLVLPDQSPDALLARHTPLIDYLKRTTSLDIELSIPSDYEDLLAQFYAGSVDLAWFGGLTYVRADRYTHAVPLALRDVDLQFTSCYLASASDSRATVRDFEGEAFSFGPRLSTSGHLMPRFFLTDDGVDPESFFSEVRYSSGHDRTAQSVANGAVTLGVANCVIVQSLLDNGALGDDQIRVVETTPPYSDYVWAAHASMDESVRMAILDALLALDAAVPEHREILKLQGANAYLPAGREDFDMIRMAAESANLLAEDDAS